MTPVIRPYAASDRTACKRVYYRAVREGTAAFYNKAQRAAWAPSPEPDWSVPDKLLDQWCFVSERNGGITGFMSLDHTGYLDMAYVLPEEMGQGTAPALYAALLARAHEAALPRLTVRASHLARRFFLKMGWQVDRNEDFAKDGQVYEVFHMSLAIAPDTNAP